MSPVLPNHPIKVGTGRRYDLGALIDRPAPFALLRACVQIAKYHGIALEFGVGEGTSTRLIAQHMRVVGFDSFQGLPEDWRPGYPRGWFAQPEPPRIPNASIVIGAFDETLPDIDFREMPRVALVHIDCDLYSSATTVLKWIDPVLQPGVVVVFDEWHGYEGCENHEQQAWRNYIQGRPELDWVVVGHSDQAWGISLV